MKQENLQADMIETIHSFMMTWSDEQLKDFQEASNNKDWTEYNKKYNIKDELTYRKYDTIEDCNLETGEVLTFDNPEEADEYFDNKAHFKEN